MNSELEKTVQIMDSIISELPENERGIETKVRTCDNCDNNKYSAARAMYYWAHHRCRHCNGSDNWSHIVKARNEFAEKSKKEGK